MADIDRVLRSNLKLRHLQLLVALDEFRHLGRASEFLSVTQPAVSKTLAEVERMFELQLFVRSTRGTEPTAYGATVVRFARAVLADYQRTRDELAAVAAGGTGRVSVGTMVVATPGLVVRSVQLLKQRSALTTVFLEEGDLTRLLPRLRVGELDLIVGRLEPGYAAPDLETEALYTERMCIVVHSHPSPGAPEPASDLGGVVAAALGDAAPVGVLAGQAAAAVLQAQAAAARRHRRDGVLSCDTEFCSRASGRRIRCRGGGDCVREGRVGEACVARTD